MYMFFLFCIYILFSVSGLTLFKLGTNYPPIVWIQTVFRLNLSVHSLLGCGCYVLSFLLYLLLVSTNKLSVLYPIAMGISSVAVMLASALILKEHISPLNWLGAIIILVGVVLINLSK